MSQVAYAHSIDPVAHGAVSTLVDMDAVQAVCVIGSCARGESDGTSDIDLLALVEDRAAAAAIRARFARQHRGRHVQSSLSPRRGSRPLFERRSTFAVHVLREAVAVYDPLSRFSTVAARHSRDAPVRNDAASLRLRLDLYAERDWCQGLYLYCLSELYSVGRAAAFTILGRECHFELLWRSRIRRARAIATDTRHGDGSNSRAAPVLPPRRAQRSSAAALPLSRLPSRGS